MSPLSIDVPHRELGFQEQSGGFRLTLKRNCSISPAGFALVFGLLAALALTIGLGFAFAGAWLVLPFAGLEAIALGVAYLVYARRAADYERFELANGRLTVEVADHGRTARHEFRARGARVCLEQAGLQARVLLREAGREMEIGRHLDAAARIAFAGELEKRIHI